MVAARGLPGDLWQPVHNGPSGAVAGLIRRPHTATASVQRTPQPSGHSSRSTALASNRSWWACYFGGPCSSQTCRRRPADGGSAARDTNTNGVPPSARVLAPAGAAGWWARPPPPGRDSVNPVGVKRRGRAGSPTSLLFATGSAAPTATPTLTGVKAASLVAYGQLRPRLRTGGSSNCDSRAATIAPGPLDGFIRRPQAYGPASAARRGQMSAFGSSLGQESTHRFAAGPFTLLPRPPSRIRVPRTSRPQQQTVTAGGSGEANMRPSNTPPCQFHAPSSVGGHGRHGCQRSRRRRGRGGCAAARSVGWPGARSARSGRPRSG